jgi:hypothetical protein
MGTKINLMEEKINGFKKQVADQDAALRKSEVEREFFKAENQILEQ